MIAKNPHFNFVEGTTKDIISFEFQLEGNSKEIDYIDFGSCSCMKGAYDPKTNKVKGTVNLGKVGVNNGVYFLTKYVKVYLDPHAPERIKQSDLPKNHKHYKKLSFKAMKNPNKRIVQLTIVGDVTFVK